jgi:hypothetical protein
MGPKYKNENNTIPLHHSWLMVLSSEVTVPLHTLINTIDNTMLLVLLTINTIDNIAVMLSGSIIIFH